MEGEFFLSWCLRFGVVGGRVGAVGWRDSGRGFGE